MKVKELLEILNKCRPDAELRLFIDEEVVRMVPVSVKDRGWFTYALGFCRWDRSGKPGYVISSIPITGAASLDDDYYVKDFSRLAPIKEYER